MDNNLKLFLNHVTSKSFMDCSICVGSQVIIHQSFTSSNMKKRAAEKYYKNKEFLLKLSPQLNRSLGCMRGLGSYVSLEGLQFLPKKLHY